MDREMVHLRFLLALAAIIFFAVEIRFGMISPEFGVVMIGLLIFAANARS